jgi:hypothetical protein
VCVCAHVYMYICVCACVCVYPEVCIMFKRISMVFMYVCVYMYTYQHDFHDTAMHDKPYTCENISQTWTRARKLSKTPIESPHVISTGGAASSVSSKKYICTYITIYECCIVCLQEEPRQASATTTRRVHCWEKNECALHAYVDAYSCVMRDEGHQSRDSHAYTHMHTHRCTYTHVDVQCMHVCQRRNKQTHEHTRMVEGECIFMMHAHTNTTHETMSVPLRSYLHSFRAANFSTHALMRAMSRIAAMVHTNPHLKSR